MFSVRLSAGLCPVNIRAAHQNLRPINMGVRCSLLSAQGISSVALQPSQEEEAAAGAAAQAGEEVALGWH